MLLSKYYVLLIAFKHHLTVCPTISLFVFLSRAVSPPLVREREP